jgi:propionyl-CoA synthetase
MPMIPQAAFAMLACARIGVTHSVVFGGFAPHELAIRINDCKPRVILTASSGIEVDRLIAYKPLVDEAIELAEHKPKKVVVFNRKLGARVPFKKYDVDYDALVYGSEEVPCVAVNATHPLYVCILLELPENQKELLEIQEVMLVHLNFQCNTFTE